VTDSAGNTATDWTVVEVMLPDDPISNGAIPNDPYSPPEEEPPAEEPGEEPGGGGVVRPAQIAVDGGSSPVVGSPLVFWAGGPNDWVCWDFDYDGSHFTTDGFGDRIGHTFVTPPARTR